MKKMYKMIAISWSVSLMLALVLTTNLPVFSQVPAIPVLQSDGLTQRIERELERIARLGGGQVGVHALHLESGRQVSFNPQVRFPMASTVKVAIAVQLLTKIERGELALTTMVDLQPSDLHPGSGTISSLLAKPGVQLSIENLLELMMVISDNSATDILLRLAGGTQAVQNRLNELGIRGMSVDRSIIQLLADLQGVTLPPAEQWTTGFYEKLEAERLPDARKKAVEIFATDPRDTSTPAAMTDLIGGQVMLFSADFAVMLPQVKGGKIRGLAVTSTKRSPAIPELPTVNEALGLKDYELIAYFAMFAPAGTPPDVVAKLNQAINAAAQSKDIQEKFAGIGFAVEPGTPEALAQRSKLETAKWAKAIADAKIEPQ